MKRKNCWEHFQCGRQPGGEKIGDLGVCPAATENKLHGVNAGINGGRSCWAIAGTLCKGKTQGFFAQKLGDCLKCDFYASVRQDEGESLITTKDILKKMKGSGT